MVAVLDNDNGGTMSDLNKAREYLSTVRVGRLECYYAWETSAHYWVSRADLAALARLLADKTPDAYSLWCASTASREVSAKTVARLSRSPR